MDKLSILIVTHNRLDYTKQTIDSLLRTAPEDASVMIIDNASTEEGMSEYLHALVAPEVNPNERIYLFARGVNDGWGAAVNAGLAIMNDHGTLTDHVLISNNDVIYGPGWYEKCMALYNDPRYADKIGIMGVWKHRDHGTKFGLDNQIVVMDDMPAVGWLLKRSVIDAVGSFRENGPCSTKGGNGEDSDYAVRVQEKGLWVAAPTDDVAQHIDGY